MLIEKTIGNIKDFPDKEIEYVEIDWHECHKRILKKHLSNGEDLGMKFSDADAQIGLKEGDVLAVIDNRVIAVSIAPSEALVIEVPTDDLIPKVCYEIGNRHAPFFRGDKPTEFYTPYEMPIKVMLEKLGVKVDVGMVKLTHDRAISAAVNTHGHSHDDGGYDGKGATSSGSFYDDVDADDNHSHEHHHHHNHGHDESHHGHDHHDHGHDHEHSGNHSHEHHHHHSHGHDESHHGHDHHDHGHCCGHDHKH